MEEGRRPLFSLVYYNYYYNPEPTDHRPIPPPTTHFFGPSSLIFLVSPLLFLSLLLFRRRRLFLPPRSPQPRKKMGIDEDERTCRGKKSSLSPSLSSSFSHSKFPRSHFSFHAPLFVSCLLSSLSFSPCQETNFAHCPLPTKPASPLPLPRKERKGG